MKRLHRMTAGGVAAAALAATAFAVVPPAADSGAGLAGVLTALLTLRDGHGAHPPLPPERPQGD